MATVAFIGLSLLSVIIGSIFHTFKKRDEGLYWTLVAIWAAVLGLIFNQGVRFPF